MIKFVRMWQSFVPGSIGHSIGRGVAVELVRRGIAVWCDAKPEETQQEVRRGRGRPRKQQ